MSSFANWQGLAKRRYGKFVDPLPSPNTFADFMDFVPKDQRPGDTYEFPVRLGLEHGVTHDVSRTAFTLLGSKDSVALPARLRGAAINMQGRIPRDVLAAFNNGVSNGGDGGGSYMDAIDAKVLGLAGGGELYREIALHYGPGTGAAAANIGVCSTVVSGTNFGSSGPMVVDLTRASWSAGLWNLMVGAYVDVYAANGSTLKESEVEVTAVDPSHNRVTLSKSGVTTDIDPTDIILPRGSKGKSCYGAQAILENTGSLFELDAAVYPQWRAIQIAIGGALTRAKIMALAAKLQQNGVKKGGKLFVNANTFADLAEEANQLQRFNENTASVKRQGAENLEYKTPAGVIEVAVDMIMKQSIAMFFATGVAKRVGSTDLTFRTQGSREWFFQELENAAGAQLQMFSNQAPICEIPYHCAILSTISNTGDTLPSA
jgi:hypothetical protein